MKFKILVAALLLFPLAPLAHGAHDVTVNLTVNAGVSTAPVWRDCDVVVPAGADAGVVLDQARADGCILEWAHSSYPGFGRYVTSIDYVHDAVVTFWAFRVNAEFSEQGIDEYRATHGDALRFTYVEWPVQLE